MKPTEEFVKSLQALKEGDLSCLRRLACRSLDESLEGFDLFTGLWWPLRQKSAAAPRREVAWIVVKLYASYPMPSETGKTLPRQMGALRPPYRKGDSARENFTKRFDKLLISPLGQVEPILLEMLGRIMKGRKSSAVDWVALTDQLSAWERESTREGWTREFIEGEKTC